MHAVPRMRLRSATFVLSVGLLFFFNAELVFLRTCGYSYGCAGDRVCGCMGVLVIGCFFSVQTRSPFPVKITRDSHWSPHAMTPS